VIDPGGMAPLPSREPFQDALGALRAFGLETCADTPPILTVPAEIGTGFLVTMAADGDISDPQIDAGVPFAAGVLDQALSDDVGVETILRQNERGALDDVGGPKSLVLVSADIERGGDSLPHMRGEGDDAFLQLESERASIKGDECRTKFEAPFEF